MKRAVLFTLGGVAMAMFAFGVAMTVHAMAKFLLECGLSWQAGSFIMSLGLGLIFGLVVHFVSKES